MTPYDKSEQGHRLRNIARTPAPIATHRSSALLDHLARLTRVRSEGALKPLGLRPRHLIALTVLRDHGGGTQQALASVLQVDRTNLVGLLNELEADGLVTRRRAPDDRRRHLVELTDAGGQRLAEAERALAEAEDDILGALDAHQREVLYRLLQQATSGHVFDCSAAAAQAEAPAVDA
ncbi:MAG: MarR family transcriptional regulator, transcriptional regulator for hemolysin [Baekduia sp.]|jgi:DNA-binding MarR family transcriptional regulator|nr:MarR family transcriptional regulator, transcriptional regulator for hemolysin [Baekduia sp.]